MKSKIAFAILEVSNYNLPDSGFTREELHAAMQDTSSGIRFRGKVWPRRSVNNAIKILLRDGLAEFLTFHEDGPATPIITALCLTEKGKAEIKADQVPIASMVTEELTFSMCQSDADFLRRRAVAEEMSMNTYIVRAITFYQDAVRANLLEKVHKEIWEVIEKSAVRIPVIVPDPLEPVPDYLDDSMGNREAT